MMTIPTEISAATILITFWDANVSEQSKITLAGWADIHSYPHFVRQPDHAPAYIGAIMVVMISFNLFGVRYFGESEFSLCLIKSKLFALASLRRPLIDGSRLQLR